MRRILLPVWVAVDVMATRIPVMDWSLNYGYCKAASEMTRRDMLEPIIASPGDVLDIRYAVDGDMAGHDVYRYPDETSWNACDETKATVVETIRSPAVAAATRPILAACAARAGSIFRSTPKPVTRCTSRAAGCTA